MGYKKNVKNVKELEQVLNKIIFDTMKVIARDAEIELKDHVQEDVYGAGTPNYYTDHNGKVGRTGDLKKSVTRDVYQVGSFTNAVIYHDPKMMKSVAPYKGNNYMGQHHSTVKGYFPQEYSYFLPRVIDEGRSGKIFGSGFWTKPRPYFTNAERYIFKNFKRDFKNGLVRRGLNVTK
jgi:hypothetical protein